MSWVLVAVLAMVVGDAAAAAPRESRYASIVIEADTGMVLSSSDADRRSYPASLTKVMTLYLVFDALERGRLRLDSLLPVSAHATRQAPSKLGLRVGQTIAVEDAVLALVTKSANDVAVVVAEAIAGSETAFAEMMTRRAQALGMTETVYRNASGLPNPAQVTTPRDQAILARALIRHHERHYRYFSTREFEWKGQSILTHNRLMLDYPGADGIKTGYIHASGFNLVFSAVREGHRLIGVVFGGNTAGWRDRRMAQLLDNGFARLGGRTEVAALEDEEEGPAPAVSAPARPGPATVRLKAPAGLDMGDGGPEMWAIQVGAFGAFEPARRAAAGAAKRLGRLGAAASVDVDKAKSGRKVLYRARLTGFTAAQAQDACRQLKKARTGCQVIQPSA